MNVLGFDPGADGAMAVLTPDHKLRVVRLKNLSRRDVWTMILGETLDPCHALIERVTSSPQMGRKSAFSFGGRFEQLLMGCTAANIPYEEVPPQTWQKVLAVGKSYPSKADRKRAHVAKAQEIFPGTKITLANADAILIAEYGYRTLYRK